MLNRANLKIDSESQIAAQRDPLFDLALWVWPPVQVVLVSWGIRIVAHRQLGAVDLVGLVLSVGISTGAGAINVAHELMHRRGRFKRALAGPLITAAGCATICLLALLPPLWRRVMDPRVVRQRPAEDAAGQ